MYRRALTIKSFYVQSIDRLSYRDDYLYQTKKASQVEQEVTIVLTCDVNFYDETIGESLVKYMGKYLSKVTYNDFYRSVEIVFKIRTKDVRKTIETFCETANNDCMILSYMNSNDELTSNWTRCFIHVFDPFEPDFLKKGV